MKFKLKAFILAIAASILFIAAKNIYSCDLSAQMDKGIYKAITLGSIDRLYIGSSMFRQGIDIYEATKLSDSTFMLAYNGFDPVNEYSVIDCLMHNGLAIKHLYVDLYAYSASHESWLAEARMFFDAPVSLKLKIIQSVMNSSRGDIFSSLYELVVSQGNDLFMFWPLYKKLASRLYYKGGAAAGKYRPGTTREKLSQTFVPSTGSQSLNPEQRNALVSIIKACQDNNIDITFIDTPKYYDVVEDKGYQCLMSEYLSMLKDYDVECTVSERLLGLMNVTPSERMRVYSFPHDEPSMFTDHIHLSTPGSKRFTSILCDKLRD